MLFSLKIEKIKNKILILALPKPKNLIHKNKIEIPLQSLNSKFIYEFSFVKINIIINKITVIKDNKYAGISR